MITRREFLTRSGQVGMAVAAGLSARPAAGQGEEKRLVVYNFDGLLGDIIKQEWIAPFEKEFGVKVDAIVAPGSSPPISKLKQQIDTGTLDADVTFLQQTDYVFAVRNNLLLPFPEAEFPEGKNLYPQFVTPHGPSLIIWTYGIAYNTAKVKEPPAAWKDLWAPRFKGKVAINEALFEQMLEATNLAWKGVPYPVDDETFARLKELKPSLVTLWTTGAQAEQLFRSGEIAVSPFWNGRTFNLQKAGIPLEFVIPREGSFARSDPYCVLRGAKHPTWGRRWINFISRADRQLPVAERAFYASPNRGVQYPGDLATKVVVSSPAAVKKMAREDYALIVDNLPAWRKRWDAWKIG